MVLDFIKRARHSKYKSVQSVMYFLQIGNTLSISSAQVPKIILCAKYLKHDFDPEQAFEEVMYLFIMYIFVMYIFFLLWEEVMYEGEVDNERNRLRRSGVRKRHQYNCCYKFIRFL